MRKRRSKVHRKRRRKKVQRNTTKKKVQWKQRNEAQRTHTRTTENSVQEFQTKTKSIRTENKNETHCSLDFFHFNMDGFKTAVCCTQVHTHDPLPAAAFILGTRYLTFTPCRGETTPKLKRPRTGRGLGGPSYATLDTPQRLSLTKVLLTSHSQSTNKLL